MKDEGKEIGCELIIYLAGAENARLKVKCPIEKAFDIARCIYAGLREYENQEPMVAVKEIQSGDKKRWRKEREEAYKHSGHDWPEF